MKKIFKGKIKLLIGLTFLALFIFNTIAYSGLATKLAITSEAMFRPNVDIRITNIKLHSAENGAVESYSPKYNVDSTTTGFVLPNTSSKITYEVTVTNYGNVRQTIYKFIKNSISTDGVNIEISNFKPVYSDTSSDYNCTTDGTTANKNCTYKNSDFTIVSNKNYDDDKENEKVFYITFSTTNPSSTAKNVIENYKYRPVYKIDFNENGGQNAPSSIYKVFGESTSLPKETPTRSSYNFAGWSKSSTSTTAEYLAGTTYEPAEDANSKDDLKNIKDVTLYAVWQKKQAKLDLNYNIDGTWYYAGYNNKIQTGIKVNGEDKGYLNDFGATYDYGTSYEIYGFKIDGVTMPYSKKYTVDGTNHLGISFNTINFKVNDTNLGSVTPTQLIVIPGTTYTVSNNVITLSDGRIATASPMKITGYTSKFSSYTIIPNSTTINTKITAQANFTKEAEKYTITLDNKSATTAGTTAIYEKYNTGIYLDSSLTKVMTTSANPIAKPTKTGYTFKGYYTKENGQGDQIINENGYITEKVTNTTYTANATLYAYYKDETKPTLTLTNSSNGNWTNKDVTITLNGADSGSGIKEYQWKENGTWTTRAIAITNGVGSITYTVDRNLEIEFRTIDNAGNVSDTKTTYVRRDTIAPKIELNGAASSSEINNSNNVTIPIKITETASGINNSEFTASDISVLINGKIVNPSIKTLTYNSVSNGVYSYTLTLSGITLNGKVTLEIAAGAVKDIATNSNSKTTLDPSITVSNIYTISLNGNGATTAGTPAIYEKYNTGIYLDSTLANAMTTSANTITKPTRSYTVSFNANNTGITIPSAITKSYSYSGHYTDAIAGTQMINENGYITSSFKNTSYTANGTLYAHWKAKPSVTIPAISKDGYTCSWNTSADGNGTTYNAGDVTDKLNTQTLYAVCKANSYTVSYNSNGGSGTMTNDTATYNSNFITKKNTFTKTGYTFNGWNEKADGTGTVWGLTTSGVYESGKSWKWTYTKNITLYAQWKANTNTKYVVKHYKQKLDGTYSSEADDTDNLTGTTDSSVSPAVKSYAGFTAPRVQTVTIAADGSTVVTYKYTRNKYTFTLGSTTGITTTGSTASGSYYYGSTITLKATANTGYIFTGWTSSNTNLVANQTNASATFTMPVGNITMTPSTGYASYTVTYDATTNGGSTAKQTASTKYKSLVDLTKKAEKSGYEFVGWNTNKDATSALSSYEMPNHDVTLYAIYKKTLTATFNYYNSKSETKSVTIYNNTTSGSITSPAALGTPSGYTFRHYSTSNAANAAKTVDANSAVVLTSNQTYYASYQKNVTAKIYYSTLTANDYIYSGASQTSVDVTAVKYLGYTGVEVDSTYAVPTAVTSSTGGASAEKYIGVSNKVSDATVITPTTANTSYYAVYTESITFHYYNGTAHTKTTLTRRMLSNGSSYSNSLSGSEPVVSNYDGASKTAWSYDSNHYESSYIRASLATGTNNLYAIYTKSVISTFNYYDGSKAATTTASSNKYYVSKDSGINTFNTNITIPDAVKANRGSYTYRGVSTNNTANASVVTPTTANTTYYSSYTYVITANFTANGGTGTAPSAVAGTGYMNYSGSKIGISVTMPSNTFTRNGYTFGGWNDTVVNKTYTAGTSVTVDSSRNFNATWNVVTYTIKYNLNGGTVSATNPTSYKVTDADITLNNPTKQGYTFTGWTGTGLSEASKAVTIKSGSYGNREYTANYSINQYYYDVNPDSGIKSFDIIIDGKTSTELTDYNQKHKYGTEATITNVVAKPGYTYTGYKVTGSMTTLTGSTNSNIKTKLGAGNGYIALTSTAKALTFDAQTLASIKYSTTPQALVFEGASNGTGSYSYVITAGNTNGYFNINGTTITTSDKVVPPVGTYKLTVQAKDNTSLVTATADITIVIEKASSTNPTLTAYSGTYDGQPHTIGVTGGSGGTIHYSTDNKTWSTTKPTRTAQGTTTVYVKVVGDSNHTDTSVISSTITINFATITYTASSYEGFYDGNQHTISVSVTKPTSGATITYSLTENGTYSATKPTVTNATTTPVTVYFKISASNYNSVSSKATITINKTNSVSPTLTAYSGTYDGKAHTIGVTGGSGGTIKYSTDQTNWSTTLPTRTDATTTPVTVYVKVFGDGNHKDTSIISSTITINKKTDVITMSSISTNYTGRKVEATATAESKTTITYTYYNGTTCSGTALSSAPVNVGDYSVKATSAGNNNYKSNSACATIKISNTNNPTTVSAVTGLKYGSTGNLVTTSNVQGTIYYSIGTELTSSNYKTSGSTSIPTASGKNADTYKVYYYVDATGTNYESTKGGPVSVTIGKAPGSISYATKSVTKDYGNASFINTLTKTGDGIVGYSSSNTGVATIDTSGKVTIKTAGTTTITATVTDGTNYTYSTKKATYTLIVNKIENTAKVSPVTGIIYGEEKSMVSTTGVQGTIYYSVGTVLTESNYLSVGSMTIPTSKGRNAGTYNIYYYVTGNSNYKVVSNNSSNPVAVVIGKKQDVVSITEKSATYTGSAIGANTATATSGTGITYTYYSSQDCSGTALSGAPINKGNYSVKATSAGNSNYTSGSKCVKHTIDFGTPTISLGDTTKTYTGSPITSVGAIGKNPNGSSVSLNYTYTYYNGTTCSGTAISAPVNYNANNYSVKATSAATSNLKSATSNCAKLTIGKATGSISYGTKSVTKAYGDAAFTNALTKIGDGSVSYASSNTNVATVDGAGKVTIKAATSTAITITATVTDGNNYTYPTKTASYTLNIGKKQDVVSITEKSATYTGSTIGANTATATSGTGITYTYYSSQDCSGTALSGAPINKGNYSVKATSAGNSNYTSGSKCVKHTIDFGTPTISLGDTTKTYTGSPITSVGAIGKNPNGSSVSLNYTYTYYNGTTCSGTAISAPVNYNANNYSVKATSAATSNLKSATSNCAKLTIGKATGSISYGTKSVTKAYGDAAFTNALTKTGDGSVSYASSNTNVATVDGAGKVTIKAATSTAITITATVTDGNNYTYPTKTASYTLNIGKKQDVVSITEKSATYTGSAIGANTATATSGTGITYTYYSSQDCSGTALSGAPINKGNYSVKATSAGNSNYTSGSKCVKHTIDFGTPTISLGDTTKTYTGSPITSVGAIGKNPNGSSVSLNYTYTYYNGTTCSGTAISAPVNYNANNYSVKATSAATSNLKSATSNCAKLTIGKATGSISYGTKSVTKAYGDAAFTNALTKTGDGSVSYASSNTNVATVDGAGKVTIKAATSTAITITATVTDGNNYTYPTKTASYTLNIGKKQDVVSITEKSATYTGSTIGANTATATSGTGITYTYYSSQDCSGTALSGAPINKGNYSVKATSAGNSNYTSGSKCVKHTIDFGTPTISLGDTTKTYTGSPITSVGAIGKNPNGSSVSLNYTYTYYNGTTCSGTAISAPVNYNANNYSVKATSAATSNLKSATSNCAKLTIGKATGSISYGTKSVTKAYGDAAFTNALTKTGDGSVSYASSNTNVATVDGAGKVTIKAATSTAITITATVTDGNNYTYPTKTASYTLNIGKKQDVVSITEKSATYTGSAIGANTATATSGTGITYTYYSSQDCSGTALSGAPINKGNYSVKATSAGNSNYTSGSKCVKHTIDFGTPTISLGDTTKTYTGSPIISVGAIGKNPNGSSVSLNYTYTYYNGTTCSGTAISAPVNYNANNYSVKATSAATSNLKSATSNCAKLTVRKVSAQNPTLTAYSGTYDGQSHTISVSGGSGGTIQYSTDNKTWSTTKPTRTNVGTTTVYVKVVGDGNHTDTNPLSSTITITAQKLPAPTNINITTAGIVTWDSVSNATKYQISIDGTNWTDATSGVDYLSKIIAATGTRTVYVRAVGTGNYSNSDDKGCTASKSVYAVTINSNSTTMGKFDPSSATISYNVIEEATYSTSSNKLSFVGITSGTTTKTLKTVTANANTGYHFGSWSSASGSITSNATLTANFTANTYKVKFASNGGTGTMADQTFTYGKAAALTANTFTKIGYTFKGWTSSDGNIYSDKQSVSNLTSIHNGSVTLTALWERNVYVISLEAPDEVYMSDNYKNNVNSAVYLRYDDGVYLNYDYNSKKVSNKMSVNSDNATNFNIFVPEIEYFIDYYKKKSDTSGESIAVGYNYKGYYYNGVKLIDENGYITKEFTNNLFTEDTSLNISLEQSFNYPNILRDGYTFEGWFKDPYIDKSDSSIKPLDNSYNFLLNGTTSIYAYWLKNVKITTSASGWTQDSVTVKPIEPSTSDSSDVTYQYCLSEIGGTCSDWKNTDDATGVVEVDIDKTVDEDGNNVETETSKQVDIHYRAVSKYAVTPEDKASIKIDKTVPTIDDSTTGDAILTAYKKGTTTSVESGSWSNEYLEFKFSDISTGPSGGIIKYCMADYTLTSTGDMPDIDFCEPSTPISPNTAIPVDSTNKKEGTYYIAYSVTSTAGITSDVGIYDARVDVTAPKIVVIPSKKDGETVTKYNTVTDSLKEFEDWATDEYIFDLSTSTDNLSGIESVLVETNKGGLLTTDSNYETIYTTKTFGGFDTIKELDPIEIQADGYRYGVITVTDNAGNSSKFTFYVKIDGVTPVVSITAKNKSGTPIKSGELSSTGLTFEITIVKAGVSGAVVYSCGTATSSYDPDNPCDPSARVGAGNTGDVLKVTGYANATSLDRIIRVKGVGGTGIESAVKSFNARIGTTAVDIVVARTDNSNRVSTSDWINSTVKFKLVSKSKNIKYCVAKSKCTPSTAITSGTVKSLTNTGTFYIGYNADSGTPSYFIAHVDTTPPTIKITPYKLKDDNTAGTKVGDTVTNGTLSITDWVKYGYYFSLSGSTDGSGSGIATTVWKYNNAGSYSVVHETATTKTYKGLKNFLLGSSGYRYAEVTLTDKAGNSRTIKVGVRIDKVAPKLVLKLYKSVDGKKSGSVIKNVTEANYSTNKWVNYRYYFDTTGSTGGSGLTVTLQANSAGTLDSNHDLTSQVYTITGSGLQVGSSGNRYVRVIAKDKAGNTTTKNVRVFIDLGKPSLTWGSHKANGSTMTINYTCSDTMSRWKNSSGTIVSSVTKSVTLSGSGSKPGKCTDRAGNTVSKNSPTWYYNQNSDKCGTHSETEYYTEYYTYTTKYLTMPVSECTKRQDYAYYNDLDYYNLCDCYVYRTGERTNTREVQVANTCWYQK